MSLPCLDDSWWMTWRCRLCLLGLCHCHVLIILDEWHSHQDIAMSWWFAMKTWRCCHECWTSLCLIIRDITMGCRIINNNIEAASIRTPTTSPRSHDDSHRLFNHIYIWACLNVCVLYHVFATTHMCVCVCVCVCDEASPWRHDDSHHTDIIMKTWRFWLWICLIVDSHYES